MDAAVFATGDVAQVLQVADAVEVGEEAGLVVLATLHDVLRDSGQVDARLAGHDRVLAMGDGEACRLRLPHGVGGTPWDGVGKVHSDPGLCVCAR